MQQTTAQSMDDSGLYYTAFQEVESGDVDEALWAKAITLAEGDVDSARYKYIKLRVERLRPADHDDISHPADAAEYGSATDVPDGYISVTEFAAKSTIDKETIIQNIIDGVWDAQKIQNQWFILEPEDYPRRVEATEDSSTLVEDETDTLTIKATRSLSNDDEIPDVEIIASDEMQSSEFTTDFIVDRASHDQAIDYAQTDANNTEVESLSLEPLAEESRPAPQKKDLVARIASIVARFTAVVAALLLITVVTNVLREMHLSVEKELIYHGVTAGVLIFLLYYVWLKTRVND